MERGWQGEQPQLSSSDDVFYGVGSDHLLPLRFALGNRRRARTRTSTQERLGVFVWGREEKDDDLSDKKPSCNEDQGVKWKQ